MAQTKEKASSQLFKGYRPFSLTDIYGSFSVTALVIRLCTLLLFFFFF